MKFRILLRCLGWAVILLLAFNILLFGAHLLQHGVGTDWDFQFKHGAFSTDNNIVGYAFGSHIGNWIVAVLFVAFAFLQYRKGNLE